jgi:hypothetical protein
VKIKDSDIKNAENLMKLLNKTKVELEGLEIAAAGAAFIKYLANCVERFWKFKDREVDQWVVNGKAN